MWQRLVLFTSLVSEIWDHVDSRVIRELDESFEVGDFPFVVDLLKVQYTYQDRDYETLTNLGWMLENIERYSEAEALYAQYKNESPKDSDSAYPLGFFYYTKKRYEECIKALEPTISFKQAPHPNTFRVVAKSYERLKKYKDAIRVWEIQRKSYPNDDATRVNIERVKAKIAQSAGTQGG
jgi:tetratricopeptide (TPR) repeat protein